MDGNQRTNGDQRRDNDQDYDCEDGNGDHSSNVIGSALSGINNNNTDRRNIGAIDKSIDDKAEIEDTGSSQVQMEQVQPESKEEVKEKEKTPTEEESEANRIKEMRDINNRLRRMYNFNQQ